MTVKRSIITSLTVGLLGILSISVAGAQLAPTVIGCRANETPGVLTLDGTATTALDAQFQPECPLLEERQLRRFVERHARGTTFAYPAIPPSCLSGVIHSGNLVFANRQITIDPLASFSESAQRLFPVPELQGSNGPFAGSDLFAASDDFTLQAGAAMTLLHLEGEDRRNRWYSFDLLVDDHFLVNAFGQDVEDFLIVASKGSRKIKGRFEGRGQIVSEVPLTIFFSLSGNVCVR